MIYIPMGFGEPAVCRDRLDWPEHSIGREPASSTAGTYAPVNPRWWKLMVRERYPNARRLLISADGGGSNGSRMRLWKIELQ